jgi:hypothetical protein
VAPNGDVYESLQVDLGERRSRFLLRQLFCTDHDRPSVFNVMVASLNIVQDRRTSC